ncbi:MAG TPA: hypothetical protein VFE23_01570 [Usitatibacter sp.]|jgi:hypothetical protein|nr:hypothetical protein [Usitatibacter sp.]
MKLGWLPLAALALAGAASADENQDQDLDLIPQAAPAVQSEVKSESRFSSRAYIENALGFTSVRSGLLVPFPPPLPPRWEERLLADARVEWPFAPNAFVLYSGRLNVLAQEDLGFPNRGNLTHDLRELYASVEPRPRDYLDAGRVNVKSGVALGFNPTDFFRARAVVDPLTADPRALREDRLGTLMVRGQRVGEGASIAAAFAPRVTDPAPIGADPDRGFNPLFSHTNGSNRWLIKGGMKLGDMDPEAVLYGDDGQWKVGGNVSRGIGQASVGYVEWSGGRRLGVIDEAIAFGRRTGTIPPSAPIVISQGSDKRFRSQLAVGASYTTESKLTLNLEYHYNEAGFSRSDWDRWFALGEGRTESSPIARELWFVRAYASDFQEPLYRHGIFLRADWADFLVPKLELTGFVLADAGDGSTLMQLEADYSASDHWTFGVLAGGTTGGRRSDFGSLPRAASVLFKATRYF